MTPPDGTARAELRDGSIVIVSDQGAFRLDVATARALHEQLGGAIEAADNKHTRLFIERCGDSLVLHLPEAGMTRRLSFFEAEAKAGEILDASIVSRGPDVTLRFTEGPVTVDRRTAIRIAELLLEHWAAWSADVDEEHRSLTGD